MSFSNTRARYRDLLGTAETIVKMNGEIQDVDTNLTDIGRRCNTRLIDKKSVNLRRLTRDSLDLRTAHRPITETAVTDND